jgi:hypothetical protein
MSTPEPRLVRDRLEAVRARITRAERDASRADGAVRLLAVSKRHSPDAIRKAYETGQRDFGENYVQELVDKAAALSDLPELRWHFIGHLQRNKVKQAVSVASAIHTVDSVRLAHELGQRAEPVAAARRLSIDSLVVASLVVFVQVNVSGEAQKSGCDPAELESVLGAIRREPSLRLAGLMTLPPASTDPEAARPYFDALARLRDAHGGAANLPELSMGMSADLEPAIRAGATWVRVGTDIFGQRPD